MGAFDHLIPNEKASAAPPAGAGAFDHLVPKVGRSDGSAQAFGQGATLGFGDEITAGVRAALPGFSDWMMAPSAFEKSLGKTGQTVSTAPTMQGRYDEELNRERTKSKSFAESNPVLSTGSNIAGAVTGGLALSALPGVGTLFKGGAGLVRNVLKGAAGGALLGGAQGFGEGEGGFDNRMSGATTGAVVGGAVGGALPVVAKGASILYEKAAPRVLNKIADVADKYAPKVTPNSLSAAAPEGGQVTGDSFLTRVADAARSGAGNVEEDAAIKRLSQAISSNGGVDKARGRLNVLGEDAFIADTGKGTERLANVGYLTSDDAADKYIAAYTTRDARTGKRFIGALGENAKAPNVKDAQNFLAAYKTQTGSELYDPVLRAGNFNVSPEMDDLLKVPAVRKAMDKIIADGAENGIEVGAAEAAHMVKRQLNKNVDAAFQSGNAVNKDFVRSIGDKWEKALWAANPGIKEADTAYAKIAQLSNPDKGNGYLERGYKFLKQGISPEAVDVSPAGLATTLSDPVQTQAFRVGASNNMLETARSGAEPTRRLAKSIVSNENLQEKLAQIYGPEQAAELVRRGQAELAYAAAKSRITAGSPTAERAVALAREAGLEPPPSGSVGMATLNWLGDAFKRMDSASGPVRSRLADLLANPNAAENAEILSLVEDFLARQARPRVSAGVSGAAGGAVSSNPLRER